MCLGTLFGITYTDICVLLSKLLFRLLFSRGILLMRLTLLFFLGLLIGMRILLSQILMIFKFLCLLRRRSLFNRENIQLSLSFATAWGSFLGVSRS
jgi:hypothetical protein